MSELKTVFITGATGLLGSYLLKILLCGNYRVYVLSRSKDNKNCEERIMDALRFWDGGKLDLEYLKNLRIIEGDIVYPDLGINSREKLEELISEVQVIVHSAASTEIKMPLDDIRKINVEGTVNVLDFALKCRKEGGKIKKINHISTAYVVGTKKNIDFTEDMLDISQCFYNTYEQSKYEAEKLVNKYRHLGLNISIFRPSMIIGDSRDGRATDFRLFYTPLRFFSRGTFVDFPANSSTYQNLINVDMVAEGIYLLLEREEQRTYHLTAPRGVSIGNLDVIADYFGFKLPNFIPLEQFDFQKLTPVQNLLVEPYYPYFNYTVKFASAETQSVLKEYNFAIPEIDNDNLLRNMAYCEKRGFIKREKK